MNPVDLDVKIIMLGLRHEIELLEYRCNRQDTLVITHYLELLDDFLIATGHSIIGYDIAD